MVLSKNQLTTLYTGTPVTVQAGKTVYAYAKATGGKRDSVVSSRKNMTAWGIVHASPVSGYTYDAGVNLSVTLTAAAGASIAYRLVGAPAWVVVSSPYVVSVPPGSQLEAYSPEGGGHTASANTVFTYAWKWKTPTFSIAGKTTTDPSLSPQIFQAQSGLVGSTAIKYAFDAGDPAAGSPVANGASVPVFSSFTPGLARTLRAIAPAEGNYQASAAAYAVYTVAPKLAVVALAPSSGPLPEFPANITLTQANHSAKISYHVSAGAYTGPDILTPSYTAVISVGEGTTVTARSPLITDTYLASDDVVVTYALATPLSGVTFSPASGSTPAGITVDVTLTQPEGQPVMYSLDGGSTYTGPVASGTVVSVTQAVSGGVIHAYAPHTLTRSRSADTSASYAFVLPTLVFGTTTRLSEIPPRWDGDTFGTGYSSMDVKVTGDSVLTGGFIMASIDGGGYTSHAIVEGVSGGEAWLVLGSSTLGTMANHTLTAYSTYGGHTMSPVKTKQYYYVP